jgi:heme-degrading monooxygenase HmoA
MVIAVLRTRLRADADLAAYQELGAQMDALVRRMPGFVSVNDYAGTDGDKLSLVCFETQTALAAWREHPEHRVAQERGKTAFFAAYDVRICEVVRAYGFPAP